MRLVKYESYIVTVKSASCLPAGEYLLYFQNVFVFEETCSCGLAILNFSGSPDDSSVFFNFYADDEIAIRKYEQCISKVMLQRSDQLHLQKKMRYKGGTYEYIFKTSLRSVYL